MKVFGITGWKNSGKTTLTERLIGELIERGVTVSSIKHTHHSVDLDKPGKDTYRHRQAGAHEVLLASSARWALMHEVRDEGEPRLEDFLARLSPVDLVLVEGFKSWPIDKLEVYRKGSEGEVHARQDTSVKAVASDAELSDLCVPVFDLNDISGIADFVVTHLGLRSNR